MNRYSNASTDQIRSGITWLRVAGTVLAAVVLVAGCSSGNIVTKQGEKSREAASVDRTTDQEFRKGVAYMQAGRDQEAERVLLSLTRTHPELAGPQANLGLVYLRTDRLDKAEAQFKRVIDLQPGNPEGYNYLGVTYRNMGEFAKAQEAYERALAVDANYAAAHLNLGILYDLYMVQLDKALMHYQKYQQIEGADDKQVKLWIADVERRVASSGTSGKEETP